MILKFILILIYFISVSIYFFNTIYISSAEKVKREYRLTKFRKIYTGEIPFLNFIDSIVDRREYDLLYNNLRKFYDCDEIEEYVRVKYYNDKEKWVGECKDFDSSDSK